MCRTLKLIISLLLSVTCPFISFAAGPPYKDAGLPIEKRVEDLLSRMTLEEKIAQMSHIHSNNIFNGNILDYNKLEDFCGNIGFGAAECFPLSGKDCKDNIRKLQEYSVNRTRLGIPLFIVTESLHGVVQDGCTIYPQNIALGSTFNTALAYEKAKSISGELHCLGFRQVLAPDIDVVRDLRWGRVEETFSEDPILCGKMGLNEVRGYLDNGISPMIKHFGAHGNPLGGLNLASVESGTRDLYDIYLKPFEMVVRNTGIMAVMSSYNSWNRVPNSASYLLMTEILRNKWKFKGYVYSDWGAVSMLRTFHKVAETPLDAAKMALDAGLDMEASSSYYKELEDAVKSGDYPIENIDAAVRRILRAKFTIGLFENPYGIEEKSEPLHSQKQTELSRRIAEESIVLLENSENILPLDLNRFKNIAVVGPLADLPQFGDYSWGMDKEDGVTPLEGIRNFTGKRAKISYAKGCDYASLDTSGICEAVNLVKENDLAIVVCGSYGSRFVRSSNTVATTGEGMDLHDISLTGAQEQLVRRVLGQGKPIVFVLVAGKPFAIPYIKENINTILLQWYGGEEAGNALANVIFGKVSPSGKLNFSFPQSTGHLPCYYNHLPTDKGYYKKPGSYSEPGRDYVFSSPAALWNFGHGLSYTEFEYISASTDRKEYIAGRDSVIKINVEIKNVGRMTAKEVVQAYIRDKVSSIVTPVSLLKDFEKVELKPGEKTVVNLAIPISELYLRNDDGSEFLEDGEFEIKIGSASDDIRFAIPVYVGKNANKILSSSGEDSRFSFGKPKGREISVKGTLRDVQATPVANARICSAWSGKILDITDRSGRFKINIREDDVILVKRDNHTDIFVKVEGKKNINIKTE